MHQQRNYDRHDRVRSLIMEVVSTFIRNEANTDPLITVTNVTIAPNYRSVTIFFTTIPDGREDDALVFLKRKGSEMRKYIKSRCNLKIIPHIDFSIDYGERHRQHIDEIAHNIEHGGINKNVT
jgi:ribosome-binding factor A